MPSSISIGEAEEHLPRYLAAVERGEEFIILRGGEPVARLGPFVPPAHRARPKVGETLDAPMEVPEAAIAPLMPSEFKAWGL